MEAARKHYDATAFRKRRALAERQWAEAQARRKTVRKQPIGEIIRDMDESLSAERQLNEKITSWRAQWEAKEWTGYPLPEKLDPSLTNPPVTRYDVTDEHRTAPPYLPVSAHPAWEDFWRRSDRRRDQFIEAHRDQMKAAQAATVAALRAGYGEETTSAQRAELETRKQQAENKTLQAKAELDAFVQRTISSANAWRMKNWEGYTAPPAPHDPPPEVSGSP